MVKVQCYSSKAFLENIFSNWTNDSELKKPKPTESSSEFIIRHFAVDVVYDAVSSIFSFTNIYKTKYSTEIFYVVFFIRNTQYILKA